MQHFIRLEHTDGHSKFYELWIEEDDQAMVGYTVKFLYGKIGSEGVGGVKVKGASMAKAMSVYNSIRLEKLGKGYVVVGSKGGSAPKKNPILTASVKPMSQVKDELNGLGISMPAAYPLSEVDILINSPDWCCQQKMNGRFLRVGMNEYGEVYGWNKLGHSTGVPAVVADNIRKVGKTILLDGELIGQTLYSFDILKYANQELLRQKPFQHRMEQLTKVHDKIATDYWNLVPPAYSLTEKAKLLEHAHATGMEGLVFKRITAPYLPGKEEDVTKSTSFKVKFWKEASVVATKWTEKNSVLVSCFKAGEGFVSVGKLTVPEKYKAMIGPILKPVILRVKYLYATEGLQLYQASLDPDDEGNVTRDDQEPEECLISQLRKEGDMSTTYKPYKEPKRSIIL